MEEEKNEGHVWIKINDIEIDSVWFCPVINSNIYTYNLREFNDYNEFTLFYGL